jgi:hypothetical protein
MQLYCLCNGLTPLPLLLQVLVQGVWLGPLVPPGEAPNTAAMPATALLEPQQTRRPLLPPSLPLLHARVA